MQTELFTSLISDLEINDSVFIKLQSARNRLHRIEECIADNALLKKAKLDMCSQYVTNDQCRSCLLIPLTIMVTPAMGIDFISKAESEIVRLLELSEQAMENL